MQLTNEQIQWGLFAGSLLSCGGVVLILSKLRQAERFLPSWTELKDLESRLPAAQEHLRELVASREALQIELGRLETEVSNLRILKSWNDANPEAPAKIQQMMLDLERYKSELDAVQQKLAAGEARIVEIEKANSTFEQTKAQQVQELSQLTEKQKTLREEIEHADKNLKDLQEQLRTKEHGLQQVHENLLAKSAELARLQTQADQASLQAKEAMLEKEKALGEREGARAELKALQAVLETTKAQLEAINSHIKATHTGPTDISASLEDLQQPSLTFKFRSANHSMSEERGLQNLASHLKSKGLLYSERVQLAFHTSLKAAQINPIVVLAGVSGTGKSALPMAYAEAIGINFLSLAVQPGWSGPQDLIGFYNYLERKFKATELSRALAQMSRYSEQDLPCLKAESRKEQMLLVLLDEMNLAKIEYYFSEFLSKLEQRRGREIGDAQRRREISLLIDAGSLSAKDKAHFLFPDNNVLFVGTMNEDESTQSLSDKVIDRANVLRFGAPKSLQASNTPTSTPAQDYLPCDQWKKWISHFDGSEFAKEQEILRKLNHELDVINRPFGHRVYKAILDYLANYPEARRDQGRLRHALADQLEQKIIPKLRGLDTQEDKAISCLDHVEQVIGSLNDKELQDAFRSARAGHLFEWYGVKRD